MQENMICSGLWELENRLYAQGKQRVCGVDEAGAGPLAGAVYAAAVILPPGLTLPYLDDSKKVTPKRRDMLFDQIREQAVGYAIAWADEAEIDQYNILNARMLAMERAIRALNPPPDYALIDGNYNKGITVPNETVVRGDSHSASIAAASILAKVSRDRYMVQMAERYPQYRFEKHKGYPTKLPLSTAAPIRTLSHPPQTFLKKL